MSAIIHTLHVLLAGAWLGGVVFTTVVVSPALKVMDWGEVARIKARSAIGGYYARVGGVNLLLLLVFALLDGLMSGFGSLLYVEYALLLVLFGLVAAHGAYFGRKLAELAGAEQSPEAAASLAERRRALQRVSSKVSTLDILVSAAIVVLATNG